MYWRRRSTVLIGLISDTHGVLPAEVFSLFDGVDLILHAGDVGSEDVLIELGTIAPVIAVSGNTDRYPLLARLKNKEFIERSGLKICLTHIIASPKTYAFQLFKMNRKVDVVVFGHTHKPARLLFNDILFVNPGSASQPRYSKGRSVALLSAHEGELFVDFKYF